MPVELTSPWWLVILLLAIPAVAIVWRRWPALFPKWQRRSALGVRIVLITALVLALAGLELSYRASSQTLVLAIDRSASTAQAQYQETPAVESLVAKLPGKDVMGVVSFGQDALVEDPPQHNLEFEGFNTSPGANFTDIESALRLAGSLAAPGTRRHLLLLSDGRQNVGDAVGEARVLREEGVRVDVLPLQVPLGPDVRVDSVEVPPTVPPGSRAQATAVLVSNETTTARVVWTLDNNQVVLDTVVRVSPGVTEVRALMPPARPGFHHVNVEISPARDTVPGNNTGEALFQVLGRQQVLVVAGGPGGATNVAGALKAAGIDATVVSPSQVPASVAGLAEWQAVALVDVSAVQLGYQRMDALATATRDLGLGLAAFGGTNTFGPGGLAGTPLEEALPVDMKVANPEEKTPVAVMLVMETVESPAGDLVLREAASQLVANLSPQDLVGVTNGASGIIVPLQRVGNGKKVEADIMGIPSFGDPPSYVPYIQDAAGALAAHPDFTKYIFVLGDGDADDPLPPPSFMADIVRQGITVSTVGADVHANPQYMANMAAIAAEGDGRFFDSEAASQLPSIFLDEAQAQLQPWIVQERFHVAAGAPSGALDGVEVPSLPPLDGYVATTPKPASQVVLSGPDGDPVLAQWQYGLGTAIAWTSDTEGRWTSELLRSPLAGRLFAGIVAATLPLAASPALSLSAQVEGDEAHLVAQATGAPSNASAVAHVVGPSGQGSDVPLTETAPGRFEGDITTTAVGAYLMRVEVTAGTRVLDAATVGVALAYSPELRFMGTDLPFLEQVARAGGGAVLTSADQALSEPVPAVNVSTALSE
ncbi:MAG TPA: hypothetical protein VEJ84_16275, partial [Acidimicrobiales bacterium]|nr:hypothetical protein [Acidimicrobiales bacterium]